MKSTTEALKKRAKRIIKASLPKTLQTVETQKKNQLMRNANSSSKTVHAPIRT